MHLWLFFDTVSWRITVACHDMKAFKIFLWQMERYDRTSISYDKITFSFLKLPILFFF